MCFYIGDLSKGFEAEMDLMKMMSLITTMRTMEVERTGKKPKHLDEGYTTEELILAIDRLNREMMNMTKNYRNMITFKSGDIQSCETIGKPIYCFDPKLSLPGAGIPVRGLYVQRNTLQDISRDNLDYILAAVWGLFDIGNYCDMQKTLTGSQRKARARWQERMRRWPNAAENLGKALKAVRKEADESPRRARRGETKV